MRLRKSIRLRLSGSRVGRCGRHIRRTKLKSIVSFNGRYANGVSTRPPAVIIFVRFGLGNDSILTTTPDRVLVWISEIIVFVKILPIVAESEDQAFLHILLS